LLVIPTEAGIQKRGASTASGRALRRDEGYRSLPGYFASVQPQVRRPCAIHGALQGPIALIASKRFATCSRDPTSFFSRARLLLSHQEPAMTTAFDFSATDIDGQAQALSEYTGKVLLVVNVASKCGFTPQYTGLEQLWRTYRDRGLVVLGFPCDQFGHQEPGDEAEIKNFCSLSYDVDFPLFAKIDVNGKEAHPLWQWLKDEKGGFLGIDAIKWNFTKFLVGRDGKVIKRYAPTETPESLAKDVEAALG
jgi:glutathione peroxidase